MSQEKRSILEKIFTTTRSYVGPEAWEHLLGVRGTTDEPESLPGNLLHHAAPLGLPDFLPELARLEWIVHQAGSSQDTVPPPASRLSVNPTLQLIRFPWKRLPELLGSQDHGPAPYPEKGEELVLVWRHPGNGDLKVCTALDEDLLALKVVVEEIEPRKAAAEGHVSVHIIDAAIERSVRKGLLLSPPSSIRRDRSAFSIHARIDERFLSASVFTLQWHITQACDLHCRHCYDRSHIEPIGLRQATALLDDFHGFCREHHVRGQVSFTGGNPFLYPQFLSVYRAAAERGFATAILGNPVPREWLDELVAIEPPVFYQVSLEGLWEHNDWIRGAGHFNRSLGFLDLLRDIGIYSMVMLTLTRDNIGQVLPLAEVLRTRTDLFTFNRLSLVGEGASLQVPSREEYIAFLQAYADAAAEHPVLALKDNLINIVQHEKGLPLFGGCAGYGCGAAFNFLTVLPDGEVHACRKFPSPIGNALHSGIREIYSSEAAHSYRAGCRACRACAIRHVCGGCLAVAYSLGLNPLEERDPYCFIDP